MKRVTAVENIKKLGIIGFGTVASGVIEPFLKKDLVVNGTALSLKRIAVRDLQKQRLIKAPRTLLTNRVEEILEDPEINVVAELIGGISPAKDIVIRALHKGKDVITANKLLIARHGDEIFREALKHNRFVGFRATIAGCYPIMDYLISSRKTGIKRIKKVTGILNGTCNYILSQMDRKGIEFKDALAEAQREGFAEEDPSVDIEGLDSAHKLSILINVIYGYKKPLRKIYVEGIKSITSQDLFFAKELGYRVKLLAVVEHLDERLAARVHPALIPHNCTLASLEGVMNGIEIEDEYGEVSALVAPGAGMNPSARAVMYDLIDVIKGRQSFIPEQNTLPNFQDIDQLYSKYYLRINAINKPGVLSQIAAIMANANINISAVIQKENEPNKFVPIIITTDEAKGKDVQRALREIRKLRVINELCLIRIYTDIKTGSN